MNYYSIDQLIMWVTQVLERVAVPYSDAATTARLLVRSDLRGYGTHGVTRLASYVEHLRQGNFTASPNIVWHRSGCAWAVDADGALGQVVGNRILEAALPFLADQPMLWVSVRESGHLGALGIFALEAAEAGFMCMVGQRTPPLLGLPGFLQPGIGHNPFAFACPSGPGLSPLVVDMACSVAARGHILLAAREGKPIPPTWALDAAGNPTTDASAALVGMLQPMGGYKGVALAMMLECLTGGLSATSASNQHVTMEVPLNGAVPRQDGFFLFLNPAIIGDIEAFTVYMNHWIDHYKHSGGDQAYVPGEHGTLQEADGKVKGLAFSPAIQAELEGLAARYGLPMPIAS